MNTAVKHNNYGKENNENIGTFKEQNILFTHSKNRKCAEVQRRKNFMKRFGKKLGETFKSKLSIAYIIFSALFIVAFLFGYAKLQSGLILFGALILGNVACTFSSMYAEDKKSLLN